MKKKIIKNQIIDKKDNIDKKIMIQNNNIATAMEIKLKTKKRWKEVDLPQLRIKRSKSSQNFYQNAIKNFLP